MSRSQRHLRAAKGFDSSGGYENVAPTDIAVSNLTIAAAAADGTTIGTISGVDPNVLPGATQEALTFSLTSNPGTLFSIVATALKKATTLTAGNKPITIRATDAKGRTFDENFVVVVT